MQHKKERIGYGRFFFGRVLGGLYAYNLLVKVRKEKDGKFTTGWVI